MKSNEFTSYANSFQAIARLRLESIELLLNFLGNPQKDLKFIHIAGTNGKGSVATYLQCILTDAGYKTGKYISPNMISVCERISVDGKDISEDDLNILLEDVRVAALKVQQEFSEYPTQFEIWTAAAFLYFKKTDCDIVVLETGLGGTQDATNIIPPPEISVITHIAMDHTEYLGDTLAKIAGEKAGIIKAGTKCTVSAIQANEAHEVLKNACQKQNVRFITVASPQSTGTDTDGEHFSYKGITGLTSSMLGIHQLDNAAVAIEVSTELGIDIRHIKSGIKRAKNIGRFEIISKDPLIIFDGAHNPDGMATLVNALNRYFPGKSKSFIMATMGDKDISGSLELIKNVNKLNKIYTVRVKDNPRAMDAERLAEVVSDAGFSSIPCNDICDALSKCADEMTVICGSLYLYKDFMEQK